MHKQAYLLVVVFLFPDSGRSQSILRSLRYLGDVGSNATCRLSRLSGLSGQYLFVRNGSESPLASGNEFILNWKCRLR